MSDPNNELCRSFAPWEKAALAPPHPGDFGIPKEHWEAAMHFAEYWHANRQEARRPAIEADEALLMLALDALKAETAPEWECNSYHPKIAAAIAALRERLEKP